MELLTVFLAQAYGKVVTLGELGSDVLDLNRVHLSCWDLDSGLW